MRRLAWRGGHRSLQANPFYFIEADVVAGSIIDLRGARRRVVGHRRGVLERAAVLQISGAGSLPKAT